MDVFFSNSSSMCSIPVALLIVAVLLYICCTRHPSGHHHRRRTACLSFLRVWFDLYLFYSFACPPYHNIVCRILLGIFTFSFAGYCPFHRCINQMESIVQCDCAVFDEWVIIIYANDNAWFFLDYWPVKCFSVYVLQLLCCLISVIDHQYFMSEELQGICFHVLKFTWLQFDGEVNFLGLKNSFS